MSTDDNKTDQTPPPQDSSEDGARQSPVLERDVAADPSSHSSPGKAEEAPASPVKKISQGDTATSPPQKGVVLQSNQTIQGSDKKGDTSTSDEDEEEAQQEAADGDEELDDAQQDASIEEEEDDIGVFLEEIFPNEEDNFPSFPLPGKASPDIADEPASSAPRPKITPESKTPSTGSAPEHSEEAGAETQAPEHVEDVQEHDAAHPITFEEPVELQEDAEEEDEPFLDSPEVVEEEFVEPLENATQEGFWTADEAPSTHQEVASTESESAGDDSSDVEEDDEDDGTSALIDEDVQASEPEEEQEQEDASAEEEEEEEEVIPPVEQPTVQFEEEEDEGDLVSIALENAREDGFVPTPAVTIGDTASPAAPLFAENIPLTEDDVREQLGRVGELARRCHMTSLAREIYQERIPTLQGRRITLVVLGEFNHGKSTVINALLGDEVLPMGITPTTAVITHLVHADAPIVTVQPPHHGKPYTIAYDAMEQAVKESGEEGEEPEYVEIGYPNEVLKESLVLVDTPGVNDISRQKVEITYGYLPRADVIVYVLDATQVLKKSEVVFIKDRLLKSSSDRIIFVLNKIDALSPEDVEEVVDYARERLQAILGHVELFTFSGRKALAAQKKREPLPQDFVDFRSYLQRFVQEQRAYIILDSALAGGQRVASLMKQNLAIKRQGYSLEKADLEQRITAVRSRLKESRRLIAENTQLIDSRVQGIAATAKHNLRIFTEQFSEQLPVQIERAEASDVKKFLPTWIQESYKEWLEKEGKALARSLEELAEEVIQITNESLQKTVQSYQDEFGLNGELDLNVDTVAYDVSVFALGAFGVSVLLFANVLVGSLLTIATPVLAYFFKEKVDTRVKERAREQGARAIEEASTKLEEELLRVIHGYGDRLKEFVEMAGDRLYRQIEEALEQVQSETAGDDVDRATLLTQVELHLKEVKKLQTDLLGARKELEDWAVEHYKLS